MQFAHIHQAAKRFANNYLAYNKRNMCETKVMVIIFQTLAWKSADAGKQENQPSKPEPATTQTALTQTIDS